MANSIFFELRLKDLMSGALLKTGSTSHSVFGSVDKDILRTKKGLDDLSTVTKIRLDTGEIERAGREVDRLNSKIQGSGFGGGGGGRGLMGGIFLGGLATQGVMMAGREVMDAGKGAFDNGVQLENMKVGLQTFVGNRANEIVEGVLKQAFYTPFTTASLLPIEMGFISTGMTPERSNKDMMNLANAVAATGGNDFILNRIGSDMMGAAAKGSIQGRELMELQRTGHINIQALVAKDLFPKMPMEQSLKRVEDMDISFKEFESAINRASEKGGMFAGALERLSQTVGGKNSTIKDMWWNVTAKLMEAQNGPIKRIQDGIINGLADIPGILAKATPVFDKIFDEFDELWPSMKAFGSGLWDLLKPIGGIFLSQEFKNAMKGLLDFGTELEQDLVPLMKGLAEAVKYLIGLIFPDKNAHKEGNLIGYFFKDTTGAAAKGLVVDDARMKKVTDSLMGSSFGPAKVFDSWKALDMFNRSQTSLNKQTASIFGIGMPMTAATKAAVAKGMGMDAASDANSSITGGGTRQIVINAHIGEHMINHFSNTKEGIKEIAAMFKEEFYHVVMGIPGMQ